MGTMIYYCCLCAMMYRLPLCAGELAAGYCRLCGVASPYVGCISEGEAVRGGIRIPLFEELAMDD